MSLFPLRAGARMAVAACALLSAIPCAVAAPGLQDYVVAERARPVAPVLPRSAFLQRGAVVAIRLSPDGKHVAWLRDRGERREVWLRATAAGTPRRILGDTRADTLDWSRDGAWLLLRSSRDLQALAVNGQAGSGRVATLGGTASPAMLDTDPSQPAAVLLVEREGPAAAPRSWRLLRVDMRGRRTTLWQDRQRIVDAVIDAQGRLAWLQRVEGGELVIHRLVRGAPQPVLRCDPSRRCALRGLAPGGGAAAHRRAGRPVAVGAAAGGRTHRRGAYRSAAHGGCGRDHRGSRRTPAALRRLPQYDLTAVRTYPHDDAHLATLRAALPGRDLDLQPGVGIGARWLVEAASPQAPLRRWHLYDPATRSVTPCWTTCHWTGVRASRAPCWTPPHWHDRRR